MTDGELVQVYVRNRSEAAFSRLVRRHLAFVYQVCRRETEDEQVAEDAALAVFLLLSKKAHTLRRGVQLTSWLFTAARLTARNAARQERRRKLGEQKAGEMAQYYEQHARRGETTASVDARLNDALAALSERERAAVLLRYQDGLEVADVGRALGISESAAKMRLSRGLEKMRRVCAAQGVTLGTPMIVSALIAAKAEAAAPTALYGKAVSMGTVGLAAGSSAVLLQKGIFLIMEATTRKTAAGIAVALIGLLGFGGVAGWKSYRAHAIPASVRGASARDTATPADRSAIAVQLERFTDAFNRKDLAALRSIVAPDTAVRGTQADDPKVQSGGQIIDAHERTFANNPDRTVYFTLLSADVRGDEATTRIQANSSMDGTSARMNEEINVQWVRHGGEWMIAGMWGK